MATVRWISTSSTAWSTAGNWDGGSVPVAGDTIVFDGLVGTASVLSGLDQSAIASGTTTLIIYKTYLGVIGVLPAGSAGGTYLKLGASGATNKVYLEQATGFGSPAGSSLLMIDCGTATSTIYIYDSSSSSSSTYYPPILIKGTAVTAYVTGGSVGFAALPGETGTFALVKLSQGIGQISPQAYFGTGATVTALTVGTGTVLSQSSNTTVTCVIENGTYTNQGTGAHTTLTINGGTVFYDGPGTITTATIFGTLDFSRVGVARTVTNCTLHGNGTLNSDNGTAGGITFTNPIALTDGPAQMIFPKGATIALA